MLAQPSVNLCIESGCGSFSLTWLFPRKFTQEGSNLFSFCPKGSQQLMALAWVLYFSPVYPSTSLDSERKLLVYSAFIAQCYFCDSIATKILEEDVGIFCPIFLTNICHMVCLLIPLLLPTWPSVLPWKEMENSQRQEKIYSLVLTCRSWGCITQFGGFVGNSLWHFCFPLPCASSLLLSFTGKIVKK